MRHDSGMSLPESGYARRPDGMNSFLGSFFLQMAGRTVPSAAFAVVVIEVEALQAGLRGHAHLTVTGWVVMLAWRGPEERAPSSASTSAGLEALTRGSDLLNLLLPLQRSTGRRP